MRILDDANEAFTAEQRTKALQAARDREKAARLASGLDYVYILNEEAAEAVRDFAAKMRELKFPLSPCIELMKPSSGNGKRLGIKPRLCI
jgi:hypothetical protein